MMAKPSLLVVEDDPALLAGVRDTLELAGYTVTTAANGRDALEVLTVTAPDLILSDVMMPKMDGFQLYAAVRERPDWVDVPFIFLTAKGEERDVYRGKELGADDYVVKPFDESDLLVAIRNKLQRRAQLERAHQSQMATLRQSILNLLSHEFRTPLTYIASYVDLLRATHPEFDTGEVRDYLQAIQDGTERLQKLVRDFTRLAELQTGEARQLFAARAEVTTELVSLLMIVVEQQRAAAKRKHLSLVVQLPEAPLPPVRLDRELLAEALGHLLENAVKFSPDGAGPITLRAEAVAPTIRLQFSDHGPGIPARDLEAIFAPFGQSGRQRTEQQGAGCGLTIAREIVMLHGGALVADSTLGQGSCFTLTLPMA
jgi:signal transduction histidine kinase